MEFTNQVPGSLAPCPLLGPFWKLHCSQHCSSSHSFWNSPCNICNFL